MSSGIYKIENLVNGKCYIGQSETISNRWKRHRTDLKCGVHDNIHLQRAYNKYGPESFKYSVVEYCEPEKELLKEREQFWMGVLEVIEKGYNMCPAAGSPLGYRHTEESKLKRSGKNHRLFGKTRSQKVKDKISKAHKGRVISEETKKKISYTLKGRIFSEETLAKLSGENSHRSRVFTFNGKTQNVMSWAKEFDINYRTLLGRLNHNWSIEEALTTPVKK